MERSKNSLFLFELKAVLLKVGEHLSKGSQMGLFICSADQDVIYVTNHPGNSLQDRVH